MPSSGQYDVSGSSTAVSRYYSLFVQDDWRVTNSLIINLGLRWEHETPTTERYNRVVNGFNPTAANPISAAAAAAYAANPQAILPASQFKALGGLTFASASNPNIYSSNSQVFSPRIGIAWTPQALGNKTVFRVGLGVFANPVGITGLNQPGFSQTTQYTSTTDNYLTSANTLSNPFPNGIGQPVGATGGTGTFLGRGSQITTFNFKSDGAKLTGTMSTRMGEREISEGKIGGDQISFVLVDKMRDSEQRTVYTGKVAGGEIQFGYHVQMPTPGMGGFIPGPPLEFTAKRVP